MECAGGADIDITKVHSDSLRFLVQEHHRLRGLSKSPLSNEKDFGKIGMAESFTNRRSSSPIGPGFESDQFKNDVMFSSASMSEVSTGGCSTSSNNATKSLIDSGDNIVFSDRFGQSSSTDLSVTDIKKEHVSEDEEGVDTCFQTNSQTVFPGMMTSTVQNTRELGICSAQSESSQDNVAFVIKQEPLTDDDDGNNNGVGTEVFEEYLLKSNEMDDNTTASGTHQNEENLKKRKTTEVEIDSTSKRAKRNATGKTYKKFGNEFHMDKVDDLDEDKYQNETEETKGNSDEEYSPSVNIGHKAKNKETGKTEMDGKVPSNTLFFFENLVGNTLNIKGTSKNLQVKIFKCPECNDIFTYESVFKKHMKKHNGDMPFKCKHCNLGFMTQFSHDLHSRVHSPDKSYTCGICGEKIKLKKDLKEHNANHTKEAQEVSSNQRTKTEQTPIAASGENESLSDVGLSPFGCSMCVFVAKDFAEIGNHVMESHFVDKRCFCDICSRRFANTDDLKLHKSLHDDQCEEISCGICEEIVDSKEDLMKHLDIHPEAKPYKCCHCGDKFIVLPQLQNHMQTHSFTKRYNCPYCFKQFFHENTLESHLRVHTGEISYICPVCDKGFRASDRLRRHMKEHPVPYSLYSNYKKEIIDHNIDVSNSHKGELQNKDEFVEEDRTDFQKGGTDTLESGTQEWKGEPGCYVDASGSDSGKSSDADTIKQEPNDIEEEENRSDMTDFSCMDNLYRPSEETVDSSSGSAIFEKLRRQRSLVGSQLPPSGHINSGTPFCISVKKLTKVAVTDKSDNTYTDAKDINTNQQFAEMEDTMKLQMNIHQCNVCGAMFAYNNMLKRHMMKHTGKEPYKCELCGHGCMSSSALKAHSLVHSGERPYSCDKCPKAFRQKSSLKSHLLTHKETFGSRRCKLPFKDAPLLQQHRQNSCEISAFGCSICNMTFKDITSVFSHVNFLHFKRQIHVCDVCCQRFDSLLSLQEHQAAHIGSQKYTCGICGNNCTDKDELNTHLHDHPSAKPFKCQVCCEKYSSVTQFTIHMESHLTDKSEQDTANDKNARLSPEANKQSESNSMDESGKRFPCKYCDLIFSTAAQRWAHSAVHDKARPYSCSVCGKKYINKGSMATHEKSHEKGKGKKISGGCSGETLGRMKNLVEQNISKQSDFDNQIQNEIKGKTKLSRLSKSKKQKTEEDSKEFSDASQRNDELFGFKEESDGIGCETVVSDTLKESDVCESSAHDDCNNEYRFIKTEPISTGYCDTETAYGEGNLPFQAHGSSFDEGLHANQNMSSTADTSYVYQMEIKTEQDMDNCDDAHRTYTCNTCDESYMNQRNLANHEKSHCTDVSEHVELICTECGAEFWKKSDLQKHIRKHHNETSRPSFKSKLKKVKMRESVFQNA
ncbi:zinc finger protein 836-like [Mizuhopecten yessoensis]|uniref:zinc finger protein 836-like n=1 Tax=Mizuhopecten yessoensis TaxID=6573 RepID=UPI000B457B95|nr:zinc finger protein 836-like [Mizuhopecten yessoensis]XP_021354148.1 zinc finger protein 836-like [Mizuhopecten yessoensis]